MTCCAFSAAGRVSIYREPGAASRLGGCYIANREENQLYFICIRASLCIGRIPFTEQLNNLLFNHPNSLKDSIQIHSCNYLSMWTVHYSGTLFMRTTTTLHKFVLALLIKVSFYWASGKNWNIEKVVVWIRLLTLEDLNWNGIAEFQKKRKAWQHRKVERKSRNHTDMSGWDLQSSCPWLYFFVHWS